MVHHDGEHNAGERGARDHDAKGGGAVFEEPSHEAGHGALEDGSGANGGDNGLGEEDLVVLGAEGDHHEAKDIDDGANAQDPFRAKVVIESANLSELVISQLYTPERWQ